MAKDQTRWGLLLIVLLVVAVVGLFVNFSGDYITGATTSDFSLSVEPDGLSDDTPVNELTSAHRRGSDEDDDRHRNRCQVRGELEFDYPSRDKGLTVKCKYDNLRGRVHYSPPDFPDAVQIKEDCFTGQLGIPLGDVDLQLKRSCIKVKGDNKDVDKTLLLLVEEAKQEILDLNLYPPVVLNEGPNILINQDGEQEFTIGSISGQVEVSCTETDNGNNPAVKGVGTAYVSGNPVLTLKDHCVAGGDELVEVVCQNSTLTQVDIACPTGCDADSCDVPVTGCCYGSSLTSCVDDISESDCLNFGFVTFADGGTCGVECPI